MKTPAPLKPRHVYLMANGDLRTSANQKCWPAQSAMEAILIKALKAEGWTVVRAHPFDKVRGHGFIDSQKMGMEVFRRLHPDAPLIVAECVWQYSHHVLHGLFTHRGPILTVANWSGTWPGLVGMLNLNGSMTKAGIRYSSLWSEDFKDDYFQNGLRQWLDDGVVTHDQSHVRDLALLKLPAADEKIGRDFARELRQRKAIMGVFDEGCMGMFNAIIPDELLHPTGLFKERLSQSSLFAEMQRVTDAEAREVVAWLLRKGMWFDWGQDEASDGDRPQQFVWRADRAVTHPGDLLGQKVLDDHLLDVAVAGVAGGDRPQRLDPVLATVADTNEDPGRERDLRRPGSFECRQATRRILVGGATVAVEITVERLNHHPLAGRHRTQQIEFVPVQRASVRMGQQAGLVEDPLRGSGEIVDGRCVPVIGEPRLRLLVAQLGTLAESEQRLMTTGPGPGAGDAHDFVERQEGCSDPGWWLGERAVVARVPAQPGQRDEHLRRVRHPASEPDITHLTCGRHQLGKRSSKKHIIEPVVEHRRTIARQYYFDTHRVLFCH